MSEEEQYESEYEWETLLNNRNFYLGRRPELLEVYYMYVKRTLESFIFLVGKRFFLVYRACQKYPLEYGPRGGPWGTYVKIMLEEERPFGEAQRIIVSPEDLVRVKEKIQARRAMRSEASQAEEA